MRRAKLILGVSAVMMAMMIALAAPAMADDRHCDDFFFDDCHHNDNFFCDDFFFDCNNNDAFGDFEQDADSGDIDQSVDVTGGGDNSNQTVGIQEVANTGNAQNQIGITDLGDNIDNFDRNRFDRFFDGNDGDFEFDDVGSSIEVSPTNTTTSDQEVNQAASAFGK
jgi:hypothetical protein